DRQAADAADAKQRKQVAEARKVVELQSKARLVDEDELSRHSELELVLGLEELFGLVRQFGERLLHRRVLHGIQLHGAEGAVHREDELAARAPDEGIRRQIAAGAHRRRLPRRCARDRHEMPPPPRSARVTALRTMKSFSAADFRSASMAFSLPMR